MGLKHAFDPVVVEGGGASLGNGVHEVAERRFAGELGYRRHVRLVGLATQPPEGVIARSVAEAHEVVGEVECSQLVGSEVRKVALVAAPVDAVAGDGRIRVGSRPRDEGDSHGAEFVLVPLELPPKRCIVLRVVLPEVGAQLVTRLRPVGVEERRDQVHQSLEFALHRCSATSSRARCRYPTIVGPGTSLQRAAGVRWSQPSGS